MVACRVLPSGWIIGERKGGTRALGVIRFVWDVGYRMWVHPLSAISDALATLGLFMKEERRSGVTALETLRGLVKLQSELEVLFLIRIAVISPVDHVSFGSLRAKNWR
jgi:hypothetical protein